MAVMGREQRKKLAVGMVKAMDAEILSEGDSLNLARQICDHGCIDIGIGRSKLVMTS